MKLFKKVFRAVYRGLVLAESSDTLTYGDLIYFPLLDVNPVLRESSGRKHYCIWKGESESLDLNMHGQEVSDIAWLYINPKDDLKSIRGFVLFSEEVEIGWGLRWFERKRFN